MTALNATEITWKIQLKNCQWNLRLHIAGEERQKATHVLWLLSPQAE
jgi:hypothetical protein